MDTDLTGMVARIDDLEQRHEHDQAALKSMARQLEEMRAERDEAKAERDALRSAHVKDTARLISERDTWKAMAMQMEADRTYVVPV